VQGHKSDLHRWKRFREYDLKRCCWLVTVYWCPLNLQCNCLHSLKLAWCQRFLVLERRVSVDYIKVWSCCKSLKQLVPLSKQSKAAISILHLQILPDTPWLEVPFWIILCLWSSIKFEGCLLTEETSRPELNFLKCVQLCGACLPGLDKCIAASNTKCWIQLQLGFILLLPLVLLVFIGKCCPSWTGLAEGPDSMSNNKAAGLIPFLCSFWQAVQPLYGPQDASSCKCC
jgi:hypothetical protein